jgi:lysozyme
MCRIIRGVVDWGKVAKSDVAFAILKATEGGDYVDETFARNLAGAEAGLVVGAYHFFTFCRPGEEQAANFLKFVPRNRSMLPPAVDIEFVGNCGARPTVADLQRELTAFLTPVEAAFGRPAISSAGWSTAPGRRASVRVRLDP